MTSNWINRYFSAVTRDVTPQSAGHSTQVLYAPFSTEAEVTAHCGSQLSNTELERAERFKGEAIRNRFIQRRAFRRYCGATSLEFSQPPTQIHFMETENGRPYLSDLADTWFSFSSCHTGFLGAWSSTHGIGVDLEDQHRELEVGELAKHFFAPAEAGFLNQAGSGERQRFFLQFWVLKEAALKSIGEGLPFGLDAFEFALHPALNLVQVPTGYGGVSKFSAHPIKGIDNHAALVLREFNVESDSRIRI